MEWLWAAVALGAGAIVGWALRARRSARRRRVARLEPTIPAEVLSLLDVANLSNIIVGTHDEVIHSSAQARSWGVVRGARIGDMDLLEAVRASRRSGEKATIEVRRRQSPGAPIVTLHARMAPLTPDFMVVLLEDRSAARRVDETKRDLVANVSHELKTPIGAISLLSEAITDAADDPEAVRRFAGRMAAESARLGELVGQIIDLSRLQSDDPMLNAAPMNVADAIAAAVDRHREHARERGIQLASAGGDARVLADSRLLADAVSNLIQNAISYSDRGARVAVASRVEGTGDDASVEITVSDNGIGIREEDQQRIFERFYRVDYGRSRASGGTGLGLSIVKHIASAHGGDVTVWSKYGQGSTFTIRLPLLLEEEEPYSDPQSEEVTSDASTGR